MIVQDLDHFDSAIDAEQITGGASTTIWATATATARGQFTFAGTYAGTATYSASFQKSS